jgi:ABC-type multidrug transport system fused ATPase/permease subunit
MELNKNQQKLIEQILDQYKLKSVIKDEILDHFCCMIENDIDSGKSFEESLTDTLKKMNKKDFEKLQNDFEEELYLTKTGIRKRRIKSFLKMYILQILLLIVVAIVSTNYAILIYDFNLIFDLFFPFFSIFTLIDKYVLSIFPSENLLPQELTGFIFIIIILSLQSILWLYIIKKVKMFWINRKLKVN